LLVMKKNDITRRMAEGGLLVSLSFLFYFIGATLSIVDIIKYISLTPIVIGVVKHGMKLGFQITIASGLLVGMFLTFFPTTIDFFLTVGIIGLTLGYCLREKFETFNTIFYSFISALIGFSLSFLMYVYIIGMDLNKEFSFLSEGISSVLKSLIEMDIMKGFVNNLTLFFALPVTWINMGWVTRFVIDLIPALLIFMAFYYVIYIWLFNVFFIKKLKIELPSKATIGEIPMFLLIPRWTLIFIPGGFVFLFLGLYSQIRLLEIVGVDILFISIFVAFLKGTFTINTNLSKKLPGNKKIRILVSLVITILEFTILAPLVVIAGILAILLKSQNLLIHEHLANIYLKNGNTDMAVKHIKLLNT